MLHTNNPIIKHKVGLLNLAEELGNVSRACKVMGVSRDTFYRYQELVESGDVDSLISRSRRVPNLKNRVDEATEKAVVDYAVEYPAYGQVRASNELRRQGISVSPSGVRSIWLRHDLESFKKRLKALEDKVNQEGTILTEAQVVALERKKKTMKRVVKLRHTTLDTLAPKTHFTSVISKVLAAFISKPLLILTVKWPLLSFTQRKRQLLQQTC